MQQPLQLQQSKDERFRKLIQPLLRRGNRAVQRFPPLVPQTIRRSMRNTITLGFSTGSRINAAPSALNVALPAEAV